jgi:hypothetical protein
MHHGPFVISLTVEVRGVVKVDEAFSCDVTAAAL